MAATPRTWRASVRRTDSLLRIGGRLTAANHRRQWRDYKTSNGRRPVKAFIEDLSSEDRANIAAAMKDVQREGLTSARHVRGDIYEVRAESVDQTFRILFAAEGKFKQVLLSVVAFSKKTRKTPPGQLELAEKRLRDWRDRAQKR